MTVHAHRRELGQYFTPADAAAFVLRASAGVLNRAPARMLDPACGDGAFLRSALDLGMAQPDGLFGIEIDPSAAKAAGPTLESRICVADALRDPLPRQVESARRSGFDLVVGNPPFGGGRGAGRLEVRFAGRFAELTVDNGVGGVILPSGVFANAATQRFRDGLLRSITPVAVVELPGGLFRDAGAAARTFALIYRKRPVAAESTCLMVGCPEDDRADSHFSRVCDAVCRGGNGMGRRVETSALRGRRWDPPYWCNDTDAMMEAAKTPMTPLGDHIERITYGPIITAKNDRAEPSGDVIVVGLRELRPTGLDLRSARRVARGGIRDPERCRLKKGDLLLARCGVGSLLRIRSAVFHGPTPATVSCFVDLIRLQGISPGYAFLCLHSKIVRAQIDRIANGVGTPNISFGEIRSLRIPRMGKKAEDQIAQIEAKVRRLHSSAIRLGRDPSGAARALEVAVHMIDNAVLSGTD